MAIVAVLSLHCPLDKGIMVFQEVHSLHPAYKEKHSKNCLQWSHRAQRCNNPVKSVWSGKEHRARSPQVQSDVSLSTTTGARQKCALTSKVSILSNNPSLSLAKAGELIASRLCSPS